MLSLQEFNALPSPKQLDYVWDNGLYLTSRNEVVSVEVKLYQVGDFFVEVRFYSLNEFEMIDAFRSTGRLLPYLGSIDPNMLFR